MNIFGRQRALRRESASESVLERIDEPFRSALLSMYRGDPQPGNDGRPCEIDSRTRVEPSEGMWLYDAYCRRVPRASLEIGMAYGFSTLYFLAAIAKNGHGEHTAIDPFEHSAWRGVGVSKVREVGAASFHFIEDSDVHAATDLARAGKTFDFIFIDGNHRFDDVLVGFTLFAALLSKGGWIIFDDTWMRGIRSALAFVGTNRPDFQRVPSPTQFAAFQRVADDARPWDHFIPFTVHKK